MMRAALIAALLLAGRVGAQVYLCEHSGLPDGAWTGATQIARVDFADRRSDDMRQWREERYPVPPSFPALVDLRSGCVAPIGATIQSARELLRACRESKREPDEAAKSARQEWRQTGRAVMQALGQPANEGTRLLPAAMYAAVSTVTNASTRRDLHLRAVTAELCLTRSQIERRLDDVPWWWVDESEETP